MLVKDFRKMGAYTFDKSISLLYLIFFNQTIFKMARRPIESQLYQELRESEFEFIANQPIHIHRIYEEVKNRHPELCDDEYLCSVCCRNGNDQPEWMHVVRGCIQALKSKNIAHRTGNVGEWIFHPVDVNRQNFKRRKSKATKNEQDSESKPKKLSWIKRLLMMLGVRLK